MPKGTPRRVTQEHERRGELVRVTVQLERGALEDLEVIVRARRRGLTRSAVVAEAVGWLLAREAGALVRERAVEQRRARREHEAARAAAQSREDCDEEDRLATVSKALELATEATGAVGPGA
jgi:hypothetical protein